MKYKDYTLKLKIGTPHEILKSGPKKEHLSPDYEPGAPPLLNVRTIFYITALLVALLPGVTVPARASGAPAITLVYPDTLQLPMRRYALHHAMRPARKSVGLALSGGGANALSQIGVLKALDEEGVPIDVIAGTSMGAIIGGLYSCGYSPEELEEIAQSLPWQSMISIQDACLLYTSPSPRD